MRTKTKKTLALLLGIIMMMITTMPSSFAALTGTEKAEFEAVLLVKDTNAAAGAFQYKEATEATELSVGDKVMIGIKAKNLHNIAEVAGTPLVDFSMGLTYDPTYLKSEPNNRLANGNLSGTKAKAALKERLAVDGSFFSEDDNGYAYSFDVNDKESEQDSTKKTYIFIIHSAAFEDGANSTKFLPNELYMAAIEFEVVSVPDPGTQVISLSTYDGDTVLKLQDIENGADAVTYQYENSGNVDTDILAVAKFTESKLNLFPLASTDVLDRITITTPATKALNSYIEGTKFEPAGMVVIPHKTESNDQPAISPTNSDFKGLKFYIDEAGKNETNLATTRELTTSTELAASDSGKHVYVSYTLGKVTKIADAGALTVNAATVDTITSVTATPGTVYNGDNVAFTDGQFSVKGKLTNGKDYTYTTAAQLASNGLAIYKNDNGTLSATLGTYTVGANKETDTNTFYVAKTSAATVANAKSFDVTVKYNKTAVQVTAAQKNALTVKYNAGDTFDTSKLKANFATLKAPTGVETAYSSFPSNATVVIAADATTAVGSSAKAITAALEASDIGKKVYIVVDNNGIKTAVEVATLAQKSGTTYSVSTQPTKMTYTYPNTLDLTGIVFKAANPDDADINNKTYTLAEAQTAGIYDKVKIGNTEITPGTTKLTKANSGKISFYKGTTLVCETNAITVNPKTLGLVRDGSDAITKVYDGATSATVAVKVNPTDVESGDTVTGSVTGLTFNYNDKNVGTGKAITATGTPALTGLDANKYTLAAASTITGITGAITAKGLNPVLVVTVSQNNAQSGDYTLTDTPATITSSDKLAADAVKVTVSGAIAEADIKAGGNGKTVKNPTYKVDNTNYVIGNVQVTANVTNLPVANDLDADTKAKLAAQTMKASDANNTEDYLITKKANLPTTGQSNVAGNDGKVTISWEVDKAYTAKGTVYTYTGTVTAADPSKLTASITPVTVTVTVNAVEVTAPTISAITAKVGDTAPALPTSGTTTGDVAVPYTITWVDGSGNPVTELKTDAVLTAIYTGTVIYDLTGKEWATEPTDKSVTLSYTVSDKDKTVINSVDDNADVNVKASDEKNTAEDIASLLPATVKAKDAAGNDVELAVTWATTDTFNAKGGEYTYTATFTDEVLADYDVSAITEPVTVKIVVAPVTVKFNKTFKDLSVKKGADNTSFETLGVAAGALSGTIKADDGTDVPYTISWSPDSTELDTSKSGNKQEFTGIVTLTAPDWMTVETIEPVKMTIKVRTSGGGGGGTAAYTVTFSAGKNGTMEGKSSVSVNAGSKVAATAVPEIKAMDGYKFVGWSIDGETTVDPTSATVSKAVKYTALYEEVTAPTPTPTQKPSIDTKYTKPYASGYEDGTFRPNNNITRCELAAMIARLINGDDIADGSYVSSFPDVAADAWANKYIGFLEDKGILSGYEDGTFRPYNTITRGEMCAVIARAQKYDIISVDDMFTDVTDADWAKDYITTLASMNIVSGYDGTLFGTYSPLTRAETVAIINRVLDPSTAIVTFTPNDIAGHWAEADIILAVNERQVNGSEPEVTPEPETTPEPEATKAPEATDDPEATKAPEATETPEA